MIGLIYEEMNNNEEAFMCTNRAVTAEPVNLITSNENKPYLSAGRLIFLCFCTPYTRQSALLQRLEAGTASQTKT